MNLHIVKRDACVWWKRALFYGIAIFAALGIGAVILLMLDVDPIEYYSQMFTMGMAESRYPEKVLMNYLKSFMPLALTSLALALAFKMKYWNIGGEGQFLMGSVAAAYVALQFGQQMPLWMTMLVMSLAAMLVAGLYGLIAGVFRVKFGTSETLLTLMLNYIALYFVEFLFKTKESWNIFAEKESAQPKFVNFSSWVAFPTIRLGENFELDLTLVLVIVIGVVLYLYQKRSKHGYEISVVGDSMGTARYAGMKVDWIMLRTVFPSAALVGLAGAFKTGTAGVLSTDTGSVGWDGIVVAWLAQLSVPAIFGVSAMMTLLSFGCVQAASEFGRVGGDFADMLQGIILFSVLAAEFFIRYRIARTKKEDGKNG